MRFVDRICWAVAIASIVGAATTALAIIWTGMEYERSWRLLVTSLVGLLTSGGVLAVNRSVRGGVGAGGAAPTRAGSRGFDRLPARAAPRSAVVPPSEVRIRQARPDDRGAVVELVRDGAGLATGFVSTAIAEGLGDLEVFVADAGDRVVAVIAVRPSAGVRVVDALVVHADHRRRGIGSTLLQRVIDRAREMQDRLVVVAVRDEAAEGFARGMGFQPMPLPASLGAGGLAVRVP